MNTFEDINNNVLKWADKRKLTKHKNRFAQYIKFQEEAGELARAILKDNREEQVDAIGDVLVTLCILSDQLNLDFKQCYDSAWHEIKDRKGKTVDGTFIKE